MSLLFLLVGCVVDLPPFQGSPTTGTSDTGPTETGTPRPTGHTGDTGGGAPGGWVTSTTCTATGLSTAGSLAFASPLVDFSLEGSVAAWPDATSTSLVAFDRSQGGFVRHWRDMGGPQSEVILLDVAPPSGVKVLVSGTSAGTGYLASAHGTSEIMAWDLSGHALGMVDHGTFCLVGSSEVLDFDILIGDILSPNNGRVQVMAGCHEAGAETALWAATFPAKGPPTLEPAVVFADPAASGDIAAHPRNLAWRDDAHSLLWLADDGDDPASGPGDGQRAVLLAPAPARYAIPPTSARVVVDSGAFLPDPTAPAMQIDSVDIDGDAVPDLVATFTAVDGRGEIWISSHVDAAIGGPTLGRDDMDYVLTTPPGTRLLGPTAILRHPDNTRSLAVALEGSGGGSIAWIDALPPRVSGTVATEVDLVSVSTVVLPIDLSGFQGFAYDLTSAGDFDGDGCDDLVVHVLEPYPSFVGTGKAYVYSGK